MPIDKLTYRGPSSLPQQSAVHAGPEQWATRAAHGVSTRAMPAWCFKRVNRHTMLRGVAPCDCRASMRKRCVTGRDYACPAIPASLPGGGGTPLPTGTPIHSPMGSWLGCMHCPLRCKLSGMQPRQEKGYSWVRVSADRRVRIRALCAVIFAALSPPPVAAPVPVSPVVTPPTPTPTPSPIPTPSVPQPSPVTQSPTTSESKSKNTVAIAAGVAGGVGLAVLAGLAIWVFVNRSKKVKAARAMSTEPLVRLEWRHASALHVVYRTHVLRARMS